MRTRSMLVLACCAAAASCANPGHRDAREARDDAATLDDLGSVHTFDVMHRIDVDVPGGAKRVRVWFPLPRQDAHQSTAALRVEAPPGWRETSDDLGNRYVYVDAATPKAGKLSVVTSFELTRSEQRADVDPAHTRPYTEAETRAMSRYLAPSTHIVLDADLEKIAKQVRGDEKNPVRVARKLYDWTLANIEYWVKDPSKWKASPVGSSQYCLQNKTGNCTDFHSLWTALARSSGLPTRMNYGSFLKASLDGQDKDQSYHCWPEFWAPEIGWVPNDVAVADIFVAPAIALDDNNREKVVLTTADGYSGPDAAKVDWYFGNLDARRVTWSVGRDLMLEPPQSAGPVNAMPKGYVEIDGMAAPADKWVRKLTFEERR